jgi:glycosyltransferase involved in cell wall biosynthesis
VRVCLVPADFSGPGCYRVLFPGRQLRLHGHEAFTPPYERVKQHGEEKVAVFSMHKFMNLMGSRALAHTMADKFLSVDCDVYVFHQQSSFYQAYVCKVLREYGRTVISETDDYHLGLPWYHPAKDSPEGRTNFKDMFLGYANSDLITVTTPFLAESYSRYAPTKVLPNYLDWEMWEDATPRYEQNPERLSLGWFGAADLRGGDLQVLAGVIGPWLERHPDVDLVIRGKGAEDVHKLLGTPEKQRIFASGAKFPDGIQEVVNSFDIGLVPLEMNNFNEAKSHLKGMEMNACGIPFIASPSQAYKDYTQEGENGFLARRPKDWIRALDALAGDASLRERMQRSARRTAERNTIQGHWTEWERVYQDHLQPELLRLSLESISRGALQKDYELAPLLGLVQSRQPKVVVEIGTAKGGTFWAWCRVAAPDALLVSIDLPGGDYKGVLGPDGYGMRSTAKLKGYARDEQEVHAWLCDSQSGETRERLERLLDGRTIDFLFIDGDHSYEGVKKDFELYSPLVDGVIAFHDIVYHSKMKSDVPVLWNEIKDNFVHQEFVSPLYNDVGHGIWGGIGVIEHEQSRIAA